MEKLQPIIKHHFWILFVLVMILPPVAWWMATGSLAAEVASRTEKLDSTLSGIKSGLNAPNSDWLQGAEKLITVRTEANRLALDRLWRTQVSLMEWPPNVRPYLMDTPYRGVHPDERTQQIIPDLYRDDYARELDRIWFLAEPIKDGVTAMDPRYAQKVDFPKSQLPRIPASDWEHVPPTWRDMWNAQEDIWLLSELLLAIQRTNAPTTSITDSFVKQISEIALFGGSRVKPDEVGNASAGAASGGAGSDFYAGGVGAMPARRSSRGATKSASFSIDEEFTVEGEFAASSGRGNSAGMAMGMSVGVDGKPEGATVDTSDPAALDEQRYVKLESEYRSRGFRLRVRVHQMRVPDLVRELLNARFPLEVVRFEQAALNPDEPDSAGNTLGGNRSGYPMAGGGYPGGGYPGGAASPDYPMGLGAEPSIPEYNDTGTETYTESETDSGPAYKGASDPAVQASLAEMDMVDFLIIGEMYMYNPPELKKDEAGNDVAPTANEVLNGPVGGTDAGGTDLENSVEGPSGLESGNVSPAAVVPATEATAPAGAADPVGTAPAATPPEPGAGDPAAGTSPAEPTTDPGTAPTTTPAAPPAAVPESPAPPATGEPSLE